MSVKAAIRNLRKDLHLLRHVNTVHASRKGQKREAPDATEAEDRDGSSESSSKMKKTEQKPLGDRWPEQQLVMVTGTIGDILPWSSRQDLMVLAPTVMCAVAIPRGWNSRSACGLWGVDPGAVKESASEFPSHLRHPPERAAGSDEQLPVGPRRDHRLIPEGRDCTVGVRNELCSCMNDALLRHCCV